MLKRFFKKPAGIAIDMKEEKNMKEEQVEFDLEIGTGEVVKEPVKAPVEKIVVKEWKHKCLTCGVNIGTTVQYCGKHTPKKEEVIVKKRPLFRAKEEVNIEAMLFGANDNVDAALKELNISDDELGQVAKKAANQLIMKMKVDGIDITDQAAVFAYVAAHQKDVMAITEEALVLKETVKSDFPLAGPMHDRFLTIMKNLETHTDNMIYGGFLGFGMLGVEEKEFALQFQTHFNRDHAAMGQHVREQLGIHFPTKNIVKNTVYVTADLSRTTGDLIEIGVTKTVQALNKYVFQMTATLIEKTVGGRPDEIKNYNAINDTAAHVWDKAKSITASKESKKKDITDELPEIK